MTHVLILCFSPLHRDPRVRRQIEALSPACRVAAAGWSDPGVSGVTFIPLPTFSRSRFKQAVMMKLRAFEAFYWSQRHIQTGLRRLLPVAATCDAILANDLEALPLALALARKSMPRKRVIFDAHEFSPLELAHSPLWRFFLKAYKTYLCRRYMPEADVCVTVNRPIADAYAQFGVTCEICMNLPAFHNLEPKPAGRRIRLIHHGIANAGRGLEVMIETAKLLDERFDTGFMLMPSTDTYMRHLRQVSADHPRIHFIDPAPFTGIIPALHHYDIGLFLLPPSSFNNLNALPNKFFEFIQARLMVAVGPSPAMAEQTWLHDCGIVAEDFSATALANRLNALGASTIDRYKHASHRAAQTLHAGVMAEKWRQWVL
ncbi:MAG: glycosyltransferase [Pseudomonadota bacterium]|nr:glycosyltransferase [Pseudomonadota bacterium]